MYLNKLKQWNPNIHQAIEPFIIKDNLITLEELGKLKDQIEQLNYLWTDRLRIPNQNVLGFYLPPSIYDQSYDDYISSIKTYKQIMYDNFYWLYQKYIPVLETYFKVPLIVNEQLHYPGFHIYKLNKNCNEGTFNQPRFHVDVFTGIGKKQNLTGKFLERITPNLGKFFTIVFAISVPSNGAGLLYTTNNSTTGMPIGNETFIPYKENQIVGWSGNLFHAIKSFKLINNERRITLQAHINLLDDKGYIFW